MPNKVQRQRGDLSCPFAGSTVPARVEISGVGNLWSFWLALFTLGLYATATYCQAQAPEPPGPPAVSPSPRDARPKPATGEVLPGPVVLRSYSGQFIVRGLSMGPRPTAIDVPLAKTTQGLPVPISVVPNASTSQVTFIRVDPTLLTVSCERIKQALLTELDMRDQWTGSIEITLHPMESFDEPIDIVNVHSRRGWNYRVAMADQVEGTRAIKAIVQVLLQEMANRNARQRAAELPQWLVEGVAANLQASALSTLTLQPETAVNKQRERNPEPMQKIRELLRSRAPLTFNELCWPAEEHLAGGNAEVYRACAQLFVFELQRLKNGHASLGRMVSLLPEYLNWQRAFLRAFEPHFQRLLDVEKWWTLNVVHLTSRELSITWTRGEAMKQLHEILKVAAHVRVNAKDLPMSAELKLQQVLSEWPVSPQTAVLVQKIRLLENLRLRVPQELLGLIDKYRGTLQTYWKNRQESGEGPMVRHPLSKDRPIVRETIKNLDELDAQREAMGNDQGP